MRGSEVELPDYPRRAYAWSVVGILSLAMVLAFIDRQIINLLVDPVRFTLNLSDTEISFLQGPAFIIFYLLVGIPAGRYVDRTNRRNIIIAGLLVWTIMTIMCGLAQSFAELFIARAGVGIGEACLAPAAYSLISDYFEPRLRGRAISLVVLSGPLGSGLSFVLGGVILKFAPGAELVSVPLLGELYGWQLTFVIAGAPGLLVAILLMLVKEVPRREVYCATDAPERPPLLPFLKSRKRPLIHLLLANGLVGLVAYAVTAWKASFYIRTYEVDPGDAGVLLGVITVVGGIAGGLLGGILSDKFAISGRVGGRFNVIAIAAGLAAPVLILWVSVDDLAISLACLMMVHALLGVGVASAPSALHDIVPNQLRGQLVAVMMLVLGLLGAGLGPVTIAWSSENLFENEIGHALLAVTPAVSFIACIIAVSGRGAYDSAIISRVWARQ